MPASKPNPNYVPPNRGGAEREPTRTCGTCNGQKTVVKSTETFDRWGKSKTVSERVSCTTCGGAGVR